MQKFCREAIACKHLQHPNILPLLGVTLAERRFAMVSEWMENGNINDFIQKNPTVNRTKLLAGVAKGLKYMHDLRVVHGDLKGANILISQDCRTCIADFGLSTIAGDRSRAATGSLVSVVSNDTVVSFTSGMTPRWASPELLCGDRPTRESDCYAFGMVIYEVLCGHVPYHGIQRETAVMQAIFDGHRPKRPKDAMDLGFTESLWETVEKCWLEDRSARPDVKYILSHLRGASRPTGRWVVVRGFGVRIRGVFP